MCLSVGASCMMNVQYSFSIKSVTDRETGAQATQIGTEPRTRAVPPPTCSAEHFAVGTSQWSVGFAVPCEPAPTPSRALLPTVTVLQAHGAAWRRQQRVLHAAPTQRWRGGNGWVFSRRSVTRLLRAVYRLQKS
jgi:hypothetical protein